MGSTHKSVGAILVVLSLFLALVFFLNGCGNNDESSAEQSSPGQTMGQTEGTMGQTNGMMGNTDGTMNMDHEQMAANANAAALADIEQKTCPVMEGNPINPDIFVEYQGKKVYFCCTACPEKFLADPEKYVSKLPQFQQ